MFRTGTDPDGDCERNCDAKFGGNCHRDSDADCNGDADLNGNGHRDGDNANSDREGNSNWGRSSSGGGVDAGDKQRQSDRGEYGDERVVRR